MCIRDSYIYDYYTGRHYIYDYYPGRHYIYDYYPGRHHLQLHPTDLHRRRDSSLQVSDYDTGGLCRVRV